MAFQFKIQLKGISKPPVWRKVLVPDTCTFADLHDIIQILFEWGNYHLYQFSPKGYGSYPTISKPSPDDWEPVDDAAKIKLKRYFKKVGDSFVYIYDFGDDWTHQIKLEAITPDKPGYPVCTGWKGVTPPEDCGGVHGYTDMLEVLKAPNNPEVETFREWLGLEEGETWEEANAFEIDIVNENLKTYKQTDKLWSISRAKSTPQTLAEIGTEPPAFYHPEVLAFYKYGLDIDKQLVAEIIQLPRLTLIEDMKIILQDSIVRMEYFINNNSELHTRSAPIHALTVLGILKAEEELDFLLVYLLLPDIYYNYWFGEIQDELFWHVVYAMGENQIHKLWDSLFETFESAPALSSITQALSQMALHGSHPKRNIQKGFEELLTNLLKMPEGTPNTDTPFITYLFVEYLSISGKENLPFIEKCYPSKRIDHKTIGSLKSLKKMVINADITTKKERFTTVDEYYDGLNNLFQIGLRDMGEEDESSKLPFNHPLGHHNMFLDEIMKPLIAPEKIGRNDLCPCGSGKKYKKCCGNN